MHNSNTFVLFFTVAAATAATVPAVEGDLARVPVDGLSLVALCFRAFYEVDVTN